MQKEKGRKIETGSTVPDRTQSAPRAMERFSLKTFLSGSFKFIFKPIWIDPYFNQKSALMLPLRELYCVCLEL